MVHAHILPARIIANVFVWSILLFGAFFIFAFKDYTMGFELAILCLCMYPISLVISTRYH